MSVEEHDGMLEITTYGFDRLLLKFDCFGLLQYVKVDYRNVP